MRKALAVLAAVALGGLAADARPDPGHRRLNLQAPPSHSLLAFRYGRQSNRLARLDPRSLRFRRGRGLDVGRHSAGWSFSPDGSLLALGDYESSDLLLVDARRLRTVRGVDTGVPGHVVATAWVGGSLVAAHAFCCDPGSTTRVFTIDPATGRVVAQRELQASVERAAVTADGLVLLLAPPEGIGHARLALAGPEGVRAVEIARIPAGSELEKSTPTVRRAQPGVAVDSSGRRAYVVGAGAPVAEIDLRTLSLSYHDLSTPISLVSRLRNWLEPAAEAKAMPIGPVRRAAWIGNGFLAVSGYDDDAWTDTEGNLHSRATAAGVRVIDTRDWSMQVLDPQASAFAVGDGFLLTWTWTWDSSRTVQIGTGLTAYGADGSRRFHLFGSQAIYQVQLVNGRALVRRDVARKPTAVVDVMGGRVLRRQAGEPPAVLAGSSGTDF